MGLGKFQETGGTLQERTSVHLADEAPHLIAIVIAYWGECTIEISPANTTVVIRCKVWGDQPNT